MQIISAASPNSRINALETLRIPNPTKLRLAIDLLISNPNAYLGTTVQLMLPRETRRDLKIEKFRSVPLQLGPEHTAAASQLGKTAGFTVQLEGSEGAVRNLVLEPGQTVEVGLLLESGQTARPGTSSRVTIITTSGNQVIGGSTFILRVPAEPKSMSEPGKK
jgi:hypothetical protein